MTKKQNISNGILVFLLLVISIVFLSGHLTPPVGTTGLISKADLEELKKAGQRTDEELNKAASLYEHEAQKILMGTSHCLTGAGKIGVSSKETPQEDDPTDLHPKFVGKRYVSKWSDSTMVSGKSFVDGC